MKIVKFKDGRFGVRSWRPFNYVYYDLDSGAEWLVPMNIEKHCKGTYEQVRHLFDLLMDKGEPLERIPHEI